MHIMLKLADKLARLILYTFVTLVIALAIMTSLLRYYLPQADQFRASLLHLLSEQTSWQIDADQLSGKWQQFRPSLSLYNAHLSHAETGHRVSLAYLKVELNIVKSIYYRRVYLENLALDGLKIVLLQDEHGSWGLAADPENKKTLQLDELADYAWSVGGLSLEGVSLTMVPYQQDTIHFPEVSASLQTWLKQKLFQVDLFEGEENRSRIVVETQNHFEDKEFLADVYWRLNDFPLHILLPLIDGLDLHKESRISQEVWLQWQQGTPSGVGSFTLESLAFDYQSKPWQAEQAQGSFYLEAQETGEITLGVPSLSVTLNKQHINFNEIKFDWREHDKLLQIAQLDLAEIDSYLALIQLSPRLQELRDSLQPQGLVKNIKVSLLEQDMLLQANLEQVTVGAWNGAPALSNVNGFVEASFFSGYVDFYSNDFTMAFPSLYDNAMEFEAAQGKVFWQVADSIQVGSIGVIELNGLYGNALGQFQLEIPMTVEEGVDDDVGRISLVVDLTEGDARYRNYLLPSILDESLLQWLDDSIVKGRVNHGSFIFHGPIEESEEQKVVELWLDVNKTSIRFHPEFVTVDDINGQFLLDQLIAEARVSFAKSQALELQNSQLHLWFTEDKPKLVIHTEFQQQAAENVLSYLQQDFITEHSGGVLSDWAISRGKVDAEIAIEVPLDAPENLNIKVEADLSDIEVKFNRLDLHLSQLGGDLFFDLHQGVSANKITAQLWEKPVSAFINASSGINQLHFDYPKASADELKHWLKLPMLSFINGDTDISGRLSWGGPQAALQVTSALQGLEISLPAPFAKKPGEEALFELLMPIESDEEAEINMGLNGQVDIGVILEGGELSATSIGINEKRPSYEHHTIKVSGWLADADISSWLSVVDDVTQYAEQNSNEQTSFDYRIDKLLIDRLNLFGVRFDEARLSVSNQQSDWLIDLVHPDLEGRLVVPAFDDKKPQLQIDQLNLAVLMQAKESPIPALLEDSSSLSFAPIHVAIDKLHFQQESYGQWQFKIMAEDDLLTAYQIEALVKSMELTAINDQQSCQLQWQMTGEEYTELSCHFSSNRIDKFLKSWGMEQGVFSEKFNLSVTGGRWLGSPADFSMSESYLPLSLSLKKGYFADVDSASTDALKALGFFNLSNLVRRLKLDFKDLTQEGLTFDSVKGQLLLDHGVLTDVKPVVIKSSASEIKVSGRGDFNQNNLDMDMAVSLPLVSNLPWVVALAAGLPAAVGVFIVSKILGKQVDKLSTAVYRITGDFDDPKVKFKRLFDVDKEKSSSKKQKKSAHQAQKN